MKPLLFYERRWTGHRRRSLVWFVATCLRPPRPLILNRFPRKSPHCRRLFPRLGRGRLCAASQSTRSGCEFAHLFAAFRLARL